MDADGARLASRRLPEGLAGIRGFHELVAAHAEDPAQVVIGIETDRGLWVEALCAAGYQMYAINPLAVARYRDRYHLSGAKSDAGDAKLLADLVRTDRHNDRPIASDSTDAEAIKVLARGHQNLIWARTRHTNTLRSALREYYPAALETFDDLADRDALAILHRAPTPAEAARLSLSKIRSALKAAGRQRNLDARALQRAAGVTSTLTRTSTTGKSSPSPGRRHPRRRRAVYRIESSTTNTATTGHGAHCAASLNRSPKPRRLSTGLPRSSATGISSSPAPLRV
jgi:transposase